MDVSGPYTETGSKCNYVLIAVAQLSGWPLGVPTTHFTLKYSSVFHQVRYITPFWTPEEDYIGKRNVLYFNSK